MPAALNFYKNVPSMGQAPYYPTSPYNPLSGNRTGVPVAAPSTLAEAVAAPPKAEQAVVKIGPESDTLAKALLAQASQGQVSTPFEALGKLAQLGVGSWAEDKFQKAEKEREAAPARSLSEALAGLPTGDQNAYRTQLGQTLMRLGGQYGNTEWVTKGAELMAPQSSEADLMAVPADTTVIDKKTHQAVFTSPAKPTDQWEDLPPDDAGNIWQRNKRTGETRKGVESGLISPDAEAQQLKLRKAGATINNIGPTGIDYGKPPDGFAWARNPDGSVKADDNGLPTAMPYPGGPAAAKLQKEKEAADVAKSSKDVSSNIVVQDVDRTLALIEASPLTTTGLVGDYLKGVPGTSASDAAALIETLEANSSFDRLQAMRDASPTGGALGQVTPRELELLSAGLGNLKQRQSKDQLVFNLKRYKNLYLDIIHGPGQGPPREQLTPTNLPTQGATRPRAINPDTKEVLEFDGQNWVPVK